MTDGEYRQLRLWAVEKAMIYRKDAADTEALAEGLVQWVLQEQAPPLPDHKEARS